MINSHCPVAIFGNLRVFDAPIILSIHSEIHNDLLMIILLDDPRMLPIVKRFTQIFC